MRRHLVTLSLVVGLATLAIGSTPPSTLWGCWKVKRALPTTNIAGLTQEQVDHIIGTRIVYSDSCAKSGQILVTSPRYVTKTLSQQEFFQFAYIPIRQLGIKQEFVTVVDLSGAEDMDPPFVGSTVFLGGKNPVIEFEGVFFELEKAKPKCDCRPR